MHKIHHYNHIWSIRFYYYQINVRYDQKVSWFRVSYNERNETVYSRHIQTLNNITSQVLLSSRTSTKPHIITTELQVLSCNPLKILQIYPHGDRTKLPRHYHRATSPQIHCSCSHSYLIIRQSPPLILQAVSSLTIWTNSIWTGLHFNIWQFLFVKPYCQNDSQERLVGGMTSASPVPLYQQLGHIPDSEIIESKMKEYHESYI